ncbi:T9SS type A sorting domain-containing protein [Mangrovimonas sp. AS39]|uniref:T9SS type A sorting domain-containing protein n=1 Tax=Mangrovimonas futianensis TaxID=2895523 RepID=UPI001E289119|nr:T9SS type A sorting domain-containing protein [Mangrovimonas futianensis]MCF1190617.1 T9SS type A sorting domain-containing protein [Mangrovimonas futianensis]MCF1194314.1 T9SS type A sorting domain-containing protein [Mangrovimonas futianensis]
MKHTYLLFVLFSLSVQSQIINFPDQTFKDQLLAANIDTNNDGEIQVSEAQEVSTLWVSGPSDSEYITDLTGIEAFTNLVNFSCYQHNIEEVDLSQNILLEFISFVHPDYNEYFNPTPNYLGSLNISGLTNLETLNITGNDMVNIQFGQNDNLLSFYTKSNAFSGLNISQTGITELTISHNYQTEISNENPFLLIGNEELTQLSTVGQYGDPNSSPVYGSIILDLTNSINIESVDVRGFSLESLFLANHPSLTYFRAAVSQTLIDLDLSPFPNLETLSLGLEGNTMVNTNECEYLEHLSIGGDSNPLLDLSQNLNLQIIQVGGISGDLDLSQNIHLDTIYIVDSNLNSINMKNGSSEGIYLYFNPSLEFICVDEEQYDDVYLEATNDGLPVPNPIVTTYCSFTPGGNYNTITGQVLFDLNNDGCQTGTESFSNVLIHVESEGTEEVSFVNSGGNYSFYSQNGSFVLTPSIEHPDWFGVSPESATVEFLGSLNNTITQDFCISPIGTHQDLEVVLTPIGNAQPGFDAYYELIFKNNGNQVTSGQVSLNFDASLIELVSVSQEQNDLNDGELIWDFEDLMPFESRSTYVTFNLNAPTETPPLDIDDVLTFSVEIVGAQEDENADNNSFELNQTVVGAFDPNDKVCLEGDIAPIEKIGDYLHYTINFENTGNAAATFVVIKDVLNESDYNLNSLQILSASHSMETRMEGNLLEFYFDNIDLGPEEQGHVTYKIKTLESLEVGDTVSNSAEIYFDYNLPLETNEAITSFESLSLIENTVQERSIKIFPNPTFGEVMIVSPSSPIQLLEVLDMNGRILNSLELNKRRTICDLSAYQKGVYFVKIKTQDGVYGSKVIKN